MPTLQLLLGLHIMSLELGLCCRRRRDRREDERRHASRDRRYVPGVAVPTQARVAIGVLTCLLCIMAWLLALLQLVSALHISKFKQLSCLARQVCPCLDFTLLCPLQHFSVQKECSLLLINLPAATQASSFLL